MVRVFCARVTASLRIPEQALARRLFQQDKRESILAIRVGKDFFRSIQTG